MWELFPTSKTKIKIIAFKRAMNYDKLTLSDLKGICKKHGLTQQGEKETIIWRIKLKDKCDSQSLKTFDGSVPYLCNEAKLRIACAKEGVSCIGNKDEMLDLLVSHLANKAGNVSSLSGSSSGSGKVDPVLVAKRVLELDELDDFAGILNIASRPGEPMLNNQSSSAAMRKAYLKLSLLIHPDKLSRSFPQAAKAFQALVRALDRLSQPPIVDDSVNLSKKGKEKTFTIARSNEGCKRTRVLCPRCKERWSESSVEGNPEYYYNFLMCGLKQYYCSTCLCEFGAMSAIHLCPYCNKSFEYCPDDYHRKICCGNEGCQKSFGFFMFHTSDHVLSELKRTVMQEHEARQKAILTKRRRAERSAGRGSANSEQAFLLGLLDECPRCGMLLEEFSEELSKQHLRECTDEHKHQDYRAKKSATAAIAEAREAKKELQASVQSAAVWQFLGAQTEQLYLLDEVQLRKHAKNVGVDVAVGSDRAEIVQALAGAHTNVCGAADEAKVGAVVLRSERDAHDSSAASYKRRHLDVRNLPTNLHSMSLPELRVVLASHGLLHLIPPGACKRDILDLIEGESIEGRSIEQAVLLIKQGADDKQEEEEEEEAFCDDQHSSGEERTGAQKAVAKRKRQRMAVVDFDATTAAVDPFTALCITLADEINIFKASGGDAFALSFNQLKEKLLKKHSSESIAQFKAQLKECARKLIQA